MDRIRYAAGRKNAPARLALAERKLSDAVMAALIHDDSSPRWREILLAAVDVERLQADGCGIEAGPIHALSDQWLTALGDGPETRLAGALGSAAAGYTRDGQRWDSVRHHWLPLEPGAMRFRVSQKRLLRDARVVMHGRSAAADCAAVVERRIIEAGMRGERRVPLVAAPGYGAQLSDLALLVSGGVDLEKTVNLARAFMAVRWETARSSSPVGRGGDLPPDGWLALRLTCLPWELRNDKVIRADISVVRRLAAGDAAAAVASALPRLRTAGIRPPLQSAVTDSVSARLWAAAFVFPIDRAAAFRAATTLAPALKGVSHV